MDREKIKRILVVEVNWLGDCIMSLPVFKALKEKYPSCYVAVMCHPRVRDIFLCIPSVDEVIEFDEKGMHKSFLSKIKFIKMLRKKKFDVAILLHRSFTRAFICLLAGIRERIGYKRPKTKLVLTRRISLSSCVHRSHYYFELFQKSGISIREKIPAIETIPQVSRQLMDILERLKKKTKAVIAISPFTNWPPKNWPKDYYSDLVRSLLEIDVGIVMIGTEYSSCNEVIRSLDTKDRLINLCGKTTLRELIFTLSRVDLLVSSDSGPAHLASALGKKVIVLFGPTSEKITSPLGNSVYVLREDVDCPIPCYNLKCLDNVCMKKITPDKVLLKIKEVMGW